MLERKVPGLRLISTLGAFELADAVDMAHAPWTYRPECAVFGRVPVLRDVGRNSRFAFGPGRS